MIVAKKGYILPLTLMLISAIMAIVTYIFIRSSVYAPLAITTIDREKARMAAISGLEIARAQLAKKLEEQKEGSELQSQQKTQTPDKRAALFLKTLLPIINRRQSFVVTDQAQKEFAKIQITISCEQGKIDLNQIYDFKKHAFRAQVQGKGDWKKIIQDMFERLSKQMKTERLFEAFEKFLKERQYKINDVTELLTIKEFEPFKHHIFYDPPGSNKEKDEKKQPIYLTDIFTVHSGKFTLEPWLFSDSVAALLDLKRTQENDTKERIEQAKELLAEFKQSNQWAQAWNKTLAKLYGKELQSLPKDIESVFNILFKPTTFMIKSHGTVEGVTQRLVAIVERTEIPSQKETKYDVTIKKLYWL